MRLQHEIGAYVLKRVFNPKKQAKGYQTSGLAISINTDKTFMLKLTIRSKLEGTTKIISRNHLAHLNAQVPCCLFF